MENSFSKIFLKNLFTFLTSIQYTMKDQSNPKLN